MIISDILSVCIEKRKKCGYSIVFDVGMSGFPVTPKKSRVSALIQSVTVLIGKNPVRKSKREWSRSIGFSQWLWVAVNSVEFRGIEV